MILSDAAWVMKQEVTATAGTSCRCSPKVLRRQMWRAGMPQRGNLRALRHEYCLWISEIITTSSHPSHRKKKLRSRWATRVPLSGFRRRDVKECGVLLGVSLGLHSSGFLLFGVCVFPQKLLVHAYTPVLYLCTRTRIDTHISTHILSLNLFKSSMLAWSQHQHWLRRSKLLSPKITKETWEHATHPGVLSTMMLGSLRIVTLTVLHSLESVYWNVGHQICLSDWKIGQNVGDGVFQSSCHSCFLSGRANKEAQGRFSK